MNKRITKKFLKRVLPANKDGGEEGALILAQAATRGSVKLRRRWKALQRWVPQLRELQPKLIEGYAAKKSQDEADRWYSEQLAMIDALLDKAEAGWRESPTLALKEREAYSWEDFLSAADTLANAVRVLSPAFEGSAAAYLPEPLEAAE